MEHKIWDDTFSSQLCCAIWVPRQEMEHLDMLRDALDRQWTEAREDFLRRATDWRNNTREIEALVV